MTDEEKRIAIAEACGGIWYSSFNGSWIRMTEEPLAYHADGLAKGRMKQEILWDKCQIPNFLNSLDAMHSAEEALSYEQLPFYILNLKSVLMNHAGVSEFDIAHATSRQRAEAYLKTIQQP